MPDWVPLKHQLDALRMDMQYILRQVISAENRGKVYRSRRGDLLPFVMKEHGVLRQLQENYDPKKPTLFKVTRLGRKIVDNDHAIREIAMAWMDFLSEEQLVILQHHLAQWPFRDPAIRKFLLKIDGEEGLMHDDFFPQAPWYWHTVGPTHVPSGLRDKAAEYDYVHGGYTGKEISAHNNIHGDDEELAV